MISAAISILCAYLFWLAVKLFAAIMQRAITSFLLPIERRLLQWLQDRAMARALGIDAGVIRMRRRLEGHG